MYFGFIILATALLLSVTAEYYSIMGLVAIFSAAELPVIVMGASLGLGKIVATVWAHNNWKRIPWSFKAYLVPAIVFLMILTSMGIFGFLSKAHLEQSTLTGDSQAQVALFDEKIKTQKDNIDSARLALKQMDATVDQTITRSTDAGSVQIAAALRKRQQKERASLQDEIGKAQATIATLQEQRAPLAMQARKIEAEVGPIKYIAALIYGDNPDANLLERAVRWVIVLIVLVFDPLALCLILAANLQFAWARHGSGGFVHDEPEEKQGPVLTSKEFIPHKDEEDILSSKEYFVDAPIPHTPYIVPSAATITSWTTTETVPDPVTGEEEDDEVEEIFEMPSEWDGQRHAFVEDQPSTETLTDSALEAEIKDRPAYFAAPETVSEDMYDTPVVITPLPELDTTPAELAVNDVQDFGDSQHVDLPDNIEFPIVELTEKAIEIENIELPVVDEQVDIVTAMSTLEAIPEIPDLLNITDDAQPEMVEVVTERIDPNTRIKTFERTWIPAPLQADNNAKTVASDFGTTFPTQAKKGDMYLRVDYLPTRLFKFNGQSWMHVDKTASDSYTYNEEYVKYLIAKIDSGEYSLDDLTDPEQDQIAEYLNK